jgi:UDP-N-acetyl-D-mannosaminuronic acid transferase (WecB/TagA/CpsF family)
MHVSGRVPEDHTLLQRIEDLRPTQIIVAMRGGSQEQLALYLRDYLVYRPGIHCVGAALAFLTGAERPIPHWAEQNAFGWIFRLISQPAMILPRIGIAVALAGMVFRYRSEMPPLRPRWADV